MKNFKLNCPTSTRQRTMQLALHRIAAIISDSTKHAINLQDDPILISINVAPRGGSRAAATSKMELFVIIVNGFQPLTIITKCSILDIEAVLDPPLVPLV